MRRIKFVSFAFAVTILTLWNSVKIGFEGVIVNGSGINNNNDVSMETLIASILTPRIIATTMTIHDNVILPMKNDTDSDTLSWPFASPDDVFVYLLHVGKAGGKSLYEALNVTSIKTRFLAGIDCRIQHQNISACPPHTLVPLQLSKRLMGHFHLYGHGYSTEHKEWLNNHTNLLLFTVRDPGTLFFVVMNASLSRISAFSQIACAGRCYSHKLVDRLVSAWNYHRHQAWEMKQPKPNRGMAAELFSHCFTSIEQVAMTAESNSANENTSQCATRGAQVLRGEIAQPVVHFRYNYEYYANAAWRDYPHKHVAVVRTEHMWSDLARLEALLGGDPSYFVSLEQRGNFARESAQYAVKSGVSPLGVKKICCLVYYDFKKYHELILAAVNLKLTEKREEIYDVQRHCGMQSEEWFFSNASKWIDWQAAHCHSV